MKNTQNILKNKPIVYFFGGAQGTGKSTLLNSVSKKLDIPLLHSGSYFSKNKTIKESKDEIVKTLLNFSKIIVDGHYTGFVSNSNNQLEQGFTNTELKYLNKASTLHFFLVDLNVFTLNERRLNDEKSRTTKITKISKELKSERQYFQKYCYLTKRPGYIFYNYSFEKTEFNIINKLSKKYKINLNSITQE